MSNQYHFDIQRIYPGFPGGVYVDTEAKYGYWEYRDGTEGGGLWFEIEGNTLSLQDYDGWYILPKYVADTLRSAGFIVSTDFD